MTYILGGPNSSLIWGQDTIKAFPSTPSASSTCSWQLNHEGGDAMLTAVKQQYNLESSEHASLRGRAKWWLCTRPVLGTGRPFRHLPHNPSRRQAFIVAKGWRTAPITRLWIDLRESHHEEGMLLNLAMTCGGAAPNVRTQTARTYSKTWTKSPPACSYIQSRIMLLTEVLVTTPRQK